MLLSEQNPINPRNSCIYLLPMECRGDRSSLASSPASHLWVLSHHTIVEDDRQYTPQYGRGAATRRPPRRPCHWDRPEDDTRAPSCAAIRRQCPPLRVNPAGFPARPTPPRPPHDWSRRPSAFPQTILSTRHPLAVRGAGTQFVDCQRLQVPD